MKTQCLVPASFIPVLSWRLTDTEALGPPHPLPLDFFCSGGVSFSPFAGGQSSSLRATRNDRWHTEPAVGGGAAPRTCPRSTSIC